MGMFIKVHTHAQTVLPMEMIMSLTVCPYPFPKAPPGWVAPPTPSPRDSLVYWKVQWEAIAEALGTGRTAMACFVQVKKTDQLTKGKGAFTDDEQQRIREGLTLYGQNWAEIASHVGGGRSRQQVMHHFKNVMDVTRKGRWSDEEDRQLASVC